MSDEVYEGEIGRLLIIAGPSGAGKSTFLESPGSFLDLSTLPPELHDLEELARNPKGIIGLGRRCREPRLENQCLHVDLSQPVRNLPSDELPRSREELASVLNGPLYSKWDLLTTYVGKAQVVDVITYFVRGEENFRRWVYRGIDTRPEGRFMRNLTALYGDTTNSSELHRILYRSWDQFVSDLEPRSAHVLDANETTYRFCPREDFLEEIQNGYRSE